VELVVVGAAAGRVETIVADLNPGPPAFLGHPPPPYPSSNIAAGSCGSGLEYRCAVAMR
jgi:hypothetical protein